MKLCKEDDEIQENFLVYRNPPFSLLCVFNNNFSLVCIRNFIVPPNYIWIFDYS